MGYPDRLPRHKGQGTVTLPLSKRQDSTSVVHFGKSPYHSGSKPNVTTYPDRLPRHKGQGTVTLPLSKRKDSTSVVHFGKSPYHSGSKPNVTTYPARLPRHKGQGNVTNHHPCAKMKKSGIVLGPRVRLFPEAKRWIVVTLFFALITPSLAGRNLIDDIGKLEEKLSELGLSPSSYAKCPPRVLPESTRKQRRSWFGNWVATAAEKLNSVG